ncbi:nephrocystin-4 isoform X2 [Patella vulgata]|uniref:nephrocystin-4 isoform X2 n=1 Tax=Patella vulgata TaxID=6465 RepID=UPI00217FD1AD|nr:nephrocystin-4 isoform X2 [Patella vulgata]
MAGVLTGNSWRDFQTRYTQLPAAFDREHEAHQTSIPLCINLKTIDGVDNTVAGTSALYQVSVSLFDLKFKCFFGRQWIGPAVPCGESKKIKYKQNVYFHTSLKNSNIVAVIEVIVNTTDDLTGRIKKSSCGWGIIRLFKYNEELPDSSRGLPLPLQTSKLYHGSPRALFLLSEPIEDEDLLNHIEGCDVNYTVCTHKVLMQVMHLLPENVVVGSKDVVPGLVDGRDSGKDKFKKPQLLNPVPVQMEHFTLHLQPYVDKFEEELCTLLKEDRAKRENRSIEGTQVSIVERRLQVGVHNGLCYVEKPQTVLLEEQVGPTSRKPTASPSARRSTKFGHKRTGSNGTNAHFTNLVLKNPIQINDLLEDPLFAVIFKLEYVIAEPLSDNDRRMSLTYARAHTRTVSLRWAVWNPFLHANQREVHLGLIGGNKQSPDEDFIYKIPDTAMQDESASKTVGGLAMFQWSTEGKEGFLPVPNTNMAYNQMSGLSQGLTNGLSPHSDVYGMPGSVASVRSEGDESFLYDSTNISKNVSKRPPSGKQKAQSSPRYAASLQVPQQGQPGVISPQGMPYAQPGMYGGGVYPQQMYMPPMIQGGIYPTGMAPMAQVGPEAMLREMPYTPPHGPVLTPIPLPVGGQGLSRAAYARLYSAGFPPIVDSNGDPPEVIDPQSRVMVNLAREHADPLQCNELIFQFLAYSKMLVYDSNGPKKNAGTVFFTFQFYRFPQMTTERLLMGQPQNGLTSSPESLPFILQRIEKDGIAQQNSPGYEIRYYIDPTYLKPGEGFLFLQHLSRQTLHIDVWDGDTLLQIGSCAVELKYLCRCGNEAVQTTFELDVIKTDYPDEFSTVTGDIKSDVKPAGTHSILQGKLHLRMANIGHALNSKSNKTDITPLPSKTQILVSQTAGNSKYKGGSLSNTANAILSAKKMVNKSRAHHLSQNREVATLLFSDKPALATTEDENEVTREGDAERKRKLARMQAIRNAATNQEKPTTAMGYRKEKAERSRDLRTIEIYRLQTKKEGIVNMLNESITTEHTIFPSFGNTEFFEFVFRNPFNIQQTFTVECGDPDVQVVTDTREWRHFKTLGQLPTQIEENMFSKEGKSEFPQLFLRPKETVSIPLKFQSFLADQSVQPPGPIDPLKSKQNMFKTGEHTDDILQSKSVRVYFKSEENKAVAIILLKIEPQPHVIDQTFRFFHPEQSFLKKTVRLPPFHTLPGSPVGGSGVNKVYIRCSDGNVITDSKATQPGEPHDVFFKVALGQSPQRKRFFIAIYVDPFLSRPIQIWQVYVHALQRVDVSCVEGQTTRLALTLKGTQASRLVRCFSSDEGEMQLEPGDQFMLTAGAVHELNVAVRPNRQGNKFYYINVVDVEYHQLVRSWLICSSCRPPIISRAFELILPVGGGKGSSKKITYTNPYPIKKIFLVRTDRADLVQLKETQFEIDGGGSHTIGLRFAPVMQTGTLEFFVYINDEEDKNEDTFKFTATYKYSEA